MNIKCKYSDCGFEGHADEYVGFFISERIRNANAENPILPKYGFHLGVDCSKCGRWQTWLPQTDHSLVAIKFYKKEQPKLF